MKYSSLVIVVLFVAASARSDNGAFRFEFIDSGSDIIACLDNTIIDFSVAVSAVAHGPFNDGSGGSHSVLNVRYVGELTAPLTGMSWTGRGGGPFVLHANGNNEQTVRVHERHDVWFADGDYPDLLWSFGISVTRNANGDVVSLRLDPAGTYVCLPHTI